jgi:hypothetical protein
MSNKSPWSEALDKKILKWVEAKGMYEGWYDGLSHKWKHGVINQIREFFPAVIEDFQELKESLLESPARYSAEEYFESKKISMKGIHAGEYIDKEDFLSFIQSLPSNAETVEKKEEVNEWLKKNWPEGKFRAFIEFMKTDRLFFVDEVRKWLNAFLKEEISFSKFVELFNEKVFEKYPASPSPAVSAPVEKKGIDLKAMEEKLNTALEKETPESLNEWLSLQEGQERAKEELWQRVRAFVGDCLIENYPSVIRIVDGLKLIITTPELSKDYAKGLLEWIRDQNYDTSDYRVGKWYQIPFRETSHYFTDSELLKEYDKHLQK